MKQTKGFTLIELMVVIAIIAIIAAIAIPGLLAAQRSANERSAQTSLKTVTTAQADFRSNDRDGNGVNDFWTADLFGLYGLIPITAGSTSLPTDTTATSIIKLIQPEMAMADGQSQMSLYGHVAVASSIVHGSPKSGYVIRAFGSEDSGAGATTLMNDTDGADYYGSCHDRTRFAFLALPESMNSGRLMFVVNEDNSIWRYNLPSTYALTFTGITTPAVDSTSQATGTGQTTLDFPNTVGDAPVYPVAPPSIGFSKVE